MLVGFSCNSAILSHLEGGEGPDQPQSECPVGTTGTVSPEPTSDCGRPPPVSPPGPQASFRGCKCADAAVTLQPLSYTRGVSVPDVGAVGSQGHPRS